MAAQTGANSSRGTRTRHLHRDPAQLDRRLELKRKLRTPSFVPIIDKIIKTLLDKKLHQGKALAQTCRVWWKPGIVWTHLRWLEAQKVIVHVHDGRRSWFAQNQQMTGEVSSLWNRLLTAGHEYWKWWHQRQKELKRRQQQQLQQRQIQQNQVLGQQPPVYSPGSTSVRPLGYRPSPPALPRINTGALPRTQLGSAHPPAARQLPGTTLRADGPRG
jgi:hypothetical protein